MVERAVVSSTPIAWSTCDTLTPSEWQAAPAEAATSSPRAANNDAALTPGSATLKVLGSRCSGSPCSTRIRKFLPVTFSRKSTAETRQPLTLLHDIRRSKLTSGTETDHLEDVFGPRAQPALMIGSTNLRFDDHAVAKKQRTDSLRGVKLVTGDRHEVDPEFTDIDRHLAHRLRRIGVDHNAPSAT